MESGEILPLVSARVDREEESSYLRQMTRPDGTLLNLPAGSRVALVSSGAIVLFEGIVQPDGSVLDLLSCQESDGEYEDF